MLELRYHVPRSQVWEGSRGGQSGKTHLHVTEPFTFGRISRQPGQALCSKKRGWYERPPEYASEHENICPRCSSIAERAGLDIPAKEER